MQSGLLAFAPGDEVWVPDANEVWASGKVLCVQLDEVEVEVGGIVHTKKMVGQAELRRKNPQTGVDDMTSLHYLHEPGLLHNVEQRAALANQRPYTFCASVLIAVNPLQRLTEPSPTTFYDKSDSMPHPYAVAENAYQQMLYAGAEHRNQSLVVSGESGAGKTETSKILLYYLCNRTSEQKGRRLSVGVADEDVDLSLDQRLLDSTPILETFGNAKTHRNNNSSRFGKFMKLQYSDKTHPRGGETKKVKLLGATVETYLLEKSRVTGLGKGERNFHIFYQLLAGATAEQVEELGLTESKDFAFLNKGSMQIPGFSDSELYTTTCKAMFGLGIGWEDQEGVAATLGAVLHLGNLNFSNKTTGEGDMAIIEEESRGEDQESTLELAAMLSGLEVETLTACLTERSMSVGGGTAGGETYQIKNNAAQAMQIRDAMARDIYGRLFDWLVSRLASSFQEKGTAATDAHHFIGVLDIFGFENYQLAGEKNQFEQLLINYANEALQALFTHKVLSAEQELYKREGINNVHVEFTENQQCVDLIASKPNGVFVALDSIGNMPEPTEFKLVEHLHRSHSGHKHWVQPHLKDKKDTFIIQHFAEKVTYTTGTFLEKNSDHLPVELARSLHGAESPLVQALYPQQDDAGDLNNVSAASLTSKEAEASRHEAKLKKQKLNQSVSSTFSQQMTKLCSLLNSTACHFVRCVKPNQEMKLGVFNRPVVVEQLRWMGLVQTCEVLQAGLPTRIAYDQIEAQYKALMPDKIKDLFRNQDARAVTAATFWAHDFPTGAYRLGRTRAFLKAGQMANLDTLLSLDGTAESKENAERVFGRMRSWLLRSYWQRAYAKVSSQRAWILLLERMRKKARCVVQLQSWGRMVNAKRRRASRKRALRRWRVAFRVWQAQRWFIAEYALIHEARVMREEAEYKAAEQAATEQRLDEERRQAEEKDAKKSKGKLATFKRKVGVGGKAAKEAEEQKKLAEVKSSHEMQARVALASAMFDNAAAIMSRWVHLPCFLAFEQWVAVASEPDDMDMLALLADQDLTGAEEVEVEEEEDFDAAMSDLTVPDTPELATEKSRQKEAGARKASTKNPEPTEEELAKMADGLQILAALPKHVIFRAVMSLVEARMDSRQRTDLVHSLHRRKSQVQKAEGSLSARAMTATDEGDTGGGTGGGGGGGRSRGFSAAGGRVRMGSNGADSMAARAIMGGAGRTESSSSVASSVVEVRASNLAEGEAKLKPCKVPGCTGHATEGLVRKFCKTHYAEFKAEWAEMDTKSLTLQNQVELLKRQLKDVGQEAAEYMELGEARDKLNAAVQKLMAGDMSAESEVEKLDKAIKLHPEYLKEEEEKAAKWELAQKSVCEEALKVMRGYIPPDIFDISKEELISKGVPKPVAQRIFSKKALWFVRMDPTDIKITHQAELNSKFTTQGLDIVEMRAVYAVTPEDFDLDNDGRKAKWRSNFKQKLIELGMKEEQNRLNNNEKRHNSYTKHPTFSALFDDHTTIKKVVNKSTAFQAEPRREINFKTAATGVVAVNRFKRKITINAHKTGYLFKQGKFQAKSWKRRFFVVKDNCVLFFNSEIDYEDLRKELKKTGRRLSVDGQLPTHAKIKGGLVFSNKTILRDCDAPGKQHTFSFESFPGATGDDLMTLAAESSALKDEWLSSLTTAVRMSMTSVDRKTLGGGNPLFKTGDAAPGKGLKPIADASAKKAPPSFLDGIKNKGPAKPAPPSFLDAIKKRQAEA
jgi:myosin heavy subunit